MQHNFSNTEWASRAHSFVRDGAWPFVYDSVVSACDAFAQVSKARADMRCRPGKTYDVQAMAKLAFHINALASWMDQAVMIERRALEGMRERVKSSMAFKAGRTVHYRTVRRCNAESVYRRLGTPDARALYVRWVSPFPPVVDATSFQGGPLELFTGQAETAPPPAFKWSEPSPYPPIPGLRFLGDNHSPLGAVAAEVAECPTSMVLDSAGCVVPREVFERRRDALNAQAWLHQSLWSMAVMLAKAGVKSLVKVVRK